MICVAQMTLTEPTCQANLSLMSKRIRPYSREEAAEYLGVSVSTLDRLIDQGELPVLRIGRRVLLRESVLERYCQRKTVIVKKG